MKLRRIPMPITRRVMKTMALKGYVIELHRMMRRLRYSGFPTYRVRQCGSVWEARVEVHPQVPSELEYSFPTRHRRDLPETAMQDAAREAFLRLSSIHRAELASTEFAHHPFREESNSVCTVQDTPCCYNPMAQLQFQQLSDQYNDRRGMMDTLEEQLRESQEHVSQLEEQLRAATISTTGASTSTAAGHNCYFFLTPPYPPAFHALLGEVDTTVTQPPAPEIVHTPLISIPSPQLGSSMETPI
uniref:Uncharacterized protein n=1 Tax=Oryza sativa subsp. japonica TaxID=39947 RepID=Q6Z3W9_ORYSJ|nr:hypothetical protein [Oryza sativa Japonica Group]